MTLPPVLRRIYDLIAAAAAAGAPCPTNAAIGKHLGRASDAGIAGNVSTIEARGLIRVTRWTNFRVVEIVATGHRTAAPPDGPVSAVETDAPGLTPREARLLGWLVAREAAGRPPASNRDMATEMGCISIGSISGFLEKLERKGYIRRHYPASARGRQAGRTRIEILRPSGPPIRPTGDQGATIAARALDAHGARERAVHLYRGGLALGDVIRDMGIAATPAAMNLMRAAIAAAGVPLRSWREQLTITAKRNAAERDPEDRGLPAILQEWPNDARFDDHPRPRREVGRIARPDMTLASLTGNSAALCAGHANAGGAL